MPGILEPHWIVYGLYGNCVHDSCRRLRMSLDIFCKLIFSWVEDNGPMVTSTRFIIVMDDLMIYK